MGSLRRGSAATYLLEYRVRIPPGVCACLLWLSCVLSCRGLCDGPITRPVQSYRMWWVWEWSQQRGGLGPTGLSSRKNESKSAYRSSSIHLDGENKEPNSCGEKYIIHHNSETNSVKKPDIPLQDHIKTKLEVHLTNLPNILILQEKFTS
jgi:hypothetical protein